MSNELSTHVGLRFSKDGTDKQIDKNWVQDVANGNYTEGVLTVSTSWEVIPLADVSQVGYCYFETLGTEEIEIGNGLTGPALLAIPSGAGAGPVLLHGIGFGTPAARAVANTSTLRYFIFSK
jgi:hypothetical protein